MKICKYIRGYPDLVFRTYNYPQDLLNIDVQNNRCAVAWKKATFSNLVDGLIV